MNKEIIKSERFGEQYTLIHHPSGLDILVWKMENYSTTEAAFATKYGSINTCFKTSDTGDFINVPEGIAHYLEHKLFESEDIPVWDLYASTGANANAFTSFDVTEYTFSTTQNWERSLEILLDFVQKPYFTKENVDKERGIIAEEIKMYEDSPFNACFYNMLKAIYREHPVKIDIGGTVESIAKITPELLYDCYNTFYNLHNMVLSIAGNVDEDKVIEICDRVLVPAKDLKLECRFPDEENGAAQKRITAEFPVGLPLFDIGFKCRPCEGIEFERKVCMARMSLQMLIGSSSPLYQQLYDEGLLNSQFGHSAFCSSGSFFVNTVSGESKDPDEVYKRLLAEIERVKKDGFDEDSFNTIKKSRYGSIVRMFGNVEGIADSMTASYFNGTTVFDEAEALADITAEDCKAALDELFCAENSAISIIEPTKE